MLGPLTRRLGRDLRATAVAEARAAGLGSGRPDDAVVTEDDLAPLPQTAQRYLRFMGVVGRPRHWSFAARFTGRFSRNGRRWMPCEAWQYNSRYPVGRVFHMRLDLGRVLPMVGRDTYLSGHGRMHGTVLGLVTVADGHGDEFDEGELVTFLNDALVLAPSMLLDTSTTWSSVDDGSFDVSFTDAERTVGARVTVDADGAMTGFATTNRFVDLPDGLQRARWTTPIEGWDVDGDQPLPTFARAVWELPAGRLPYIEGRFEPGSVTYDTAPEVRP
jgi:Family of unknown function (DUF6544)